MVGKVGLEPTRLTAKVFETFLSAYSNIHPYNGAGERIRTPKLMILSHSPIPFGYTGIMAAPVGLEPTTPRLMVLDARIELT